MSERGKVVKLEPVMVGDRYVTPPDQVLEEAKGRLPSMVLVIGVDEDDELYVASSKNAGLSLILLEQAKHHIVFGDD